MSHVVLLGDSIFDNAAYVGGAPDVVRQLRPRLPDGWRATLLAVDGSVTTGVPAQLARLPGDASHLVVSAGGNDALRHMPVLYQAVRSTAESLTHLAAVIAGFDRDYAAMLTAVRARGLPAAVCTIYDPKFPDPELQRLAVTALALFNDVILRRAIAAGLPVLDLRLICDEPADYANPIEPSAHGGEKITAAIARMLAGHDFARDVTAVFR